MHFKHSQLITESISQNIIIAHLVVWTWQTIEFNRIKSWLTMGNSVAFCGNFGNSYFVYNIRMKESI